MSKQLFGLFSKGNHNFTAQSFFENRSSLWHKQEDEASKNATIWQTLGEPLFRLGRSLQDAIGNNNFFSIFADELFRFIFCLSSITSFSPPHRISRSHSEAWFSACLFFLMPNSFLILEVLFSLLPLKASPRLCESSRGYR